MAARRSFLEVPIQDRARSPLVEGQMHPGRIFGILAIAKQKPDRAAKMKGSDGETLLASEGVQMMHVKVLGKPKTRRAAAPEEVPRFLAVLCGKLALSVLEGADLLETLVVRGVDRNRAEDLFESLRD